MKKLIILFLMMFSFSLAFSTLTDGNDLYYSFDEDNVSGTTMIDLAGNYNGTCQNMASGCNTVEGLLLNASEFDGVTDQISVSSFANSSDLSISVWFNYDTDTSDPTLVGKTQGPAASQIAYYIDISSGTLRYRVNINGSLSTLIPVKVVSPSTWYHTVLTWNGSHLLGYVNNVLELNDSTLSAGPILAINSKLEIGRRDGSKDLDGKLDELGIYNRALTSSEISQLYNNGTGLNPYNVTPVPPESDITFNNPQQGDFFNTTSIDLNVSFSQLTNATYNFNDAGDTFLCSNCNESSNITLTGVAGVNNLSVSTNTTGTIIQENISFTIDLIAPVINQVNIPTEWTNFTLTNLSVNFTEANLQSCTVVWSEGANSDCNQTTFTKVFTTNGLKYYNVTVTDKAGSSTTQSGTVLINPRAFLYFELSNGTAVTDFTLGGESFTNYANISFYNDLITVSDTAPNNLTFSKSGFVTEGILFNITTTNETFNGTFVVTPASITVNLYDRETLNLITENLTVQLIGSTGAIDTTTTGTIGFSDVNFVLGDYQIIASGENYTTETIYFTFTGQEATQIDLYLLSTASTDAGSIIINVQNTLSQFVEGARVSALEWIPADSAYRAVAFGETNINGEVILNIEIGTKLYKFQAEKAGVIKITNSQIIQSDLSTLKIILEDTAAIIESDLEDISYVFNETVTGNVSSIYFYYTDTNNVVNEGCLKTYKVVGTTKTLLGENCTSTPTALMFQSNLINNSYDIEIVGGVTTSDGLFYPLASAFHEGTASIGFSLEEYGLDVYLPLVFYLLAVAVGVFFGNIYIGAMLGIVMSWLAVFIVPSVIAVSEGVVITMLSLLMLWGGYKRK